MVYELGHYTMEAIKKNLCAKGESITRWLKKFRTDCKNLDDERLGNLKNVNFKAGLHVIEAHPASYIQILTIQSGFSTKTTGYLLHAPPYGQVWLKAFFRWVRAQGRSPHAPDIS